MTNEEYRASYIIRLKQCETIPNLSAFDKDYIISGLVVYLTREQAADFEAHRERDDTAMLEWPQP